MISTPVNDVSAVSMYKAGKGAVKNGSDQAEELAGSFQDAMNQAKSNQTDAVTGKGSAKNAVSGSITRVSDSGAGNTIKKDSSVKQADNASKADNSKGAEKTEKPGEAKEEREVKETDDVGKAVDKAADKTEEEVVEKVADELDVTEEEVEDAMEALGLTVMDLANPSDMAALVNELSGEDDPLAFLTDGNLFESVKQLAEEVEGIIDVNAEALSGETGLDMDEALSMMEASLKEEPMQGAETVEMQEKAPVIVETDREPVSGEPERINGEENQDKVSEENVISKVDDDKNASDKASGQNQNMLQSGQDGSPLVNQMMNQDLSAVGEMQDVEVPFSSYVDTEDIINQIADYVKIHQSESLSEMEISLNPESLGHIRLQVASREGVITAAITTENEAVRQALMVQAMTLKEELNEQGLKVEAVEVTVASHEFERDMSGGGEEAQNLFERQVQKQLRRRIVVDSLEQAEEMLADEDLTDAERLQIDMMAKSGNSVDFTA